jgi:O-methyltransferase
MMKGDMSNPPSPGFGRKRRKHPLHEILYRLGDAQFVMDSGLRAIVRAWDLVSPSPFSVLYRKVRAYTMCSNSRLRALHEACKYVVRNDIRGAIVECGSARGGSAALMALTLKRLGAQRNVWLFDTFEGLPAPTADDPDFAMANLFTGTCVGAIEDVQHLFAQLGVEKDARFVKGLFQDTLATASVGPIALLHIDGDWYESVRVCLEQLYGRVSPGGVIQFDDYGYWKGARKAIDEFLLHHRIPYPLEKIDYSGRSLVKRG